MWYLKLLCFKPLSAPNQKFADFNIKGIDVRIYIYIQKYST